MYCHFVINCKIWKKSKIRSQYDKKEIKERTKGTKKIENELKKKVQNSKSKLKRKRKVQIEKGEKVQITIGNSKLESKKKKKIIPKTMM